MQLLANHSEHTCYWEYTLTILSYLHTDTTTCTGYYNEMK